MPSLDRRSPGRSSTRPASTTRRPTPRRSPQVPPAGARRGLLAVFASAALGLAACASAPPEAVHERVDERTAVNVVTLPEPLVYTGTGGGLGAGQDLALGPVEVNRMGRRSWYLWVSRLADRDAPPPRLRLRAGDEVLLEPQPLPDLQLPVSRAPYRGVAGWAAEHWYALAGDDLVRLLGQPGLVVELETRGGWQRYEPWVRESAALDAFITRQVGSAVAAR